MVEKRSIKSLIQLSENMTDEELDRHKQFIISQLEGLSCSDVRRDARLALRIIEEEMFARNELKFLQKK